MTTILNIKAQDHEGAELCAMLAKWVNELLKAVPTEAIRIRIKPGDEQTPLLFSLHQDNDEGDMIFVAHRNPLEAIPNE